MHTSIAVTVQLFGVTGALYDKALDGLDQEALFARPADAANPIVWIAGHLAYSRTGVARALGATLDLPWPGVFARGVKDAPSDAYPDITDIRSAWTVASTALMKHLDVLDEGALAAPSPRRLPIPDSTVCGAINFAAFHESYHVGQMAYIRRWLGFPGLVDG